MDKDIQHVLKELAMHLQHCHFTTAPNPDQQVNQDRRATPATQAAKKKTLAYISSLDRKATFLAIAKQIQSTQDLGDQLEDTSHPPAPRLGRQGAKKYI